MSKGFSKEEAEQVYRNRKALGIPDGLDTMSMSDALSIPGLFSEYEDYVRENSNPEELPEDIKAFLARN